METLCPSCQQSGYCWFEQKANTVAQAVQKLEDPSAQMYAALQAHMTIATDRETARDQLQCLRINEVNPSYPGIELL